jgi:hypothetical protein
VGLTAKGQAVHELEAVAVCTISPEGVDKNVEKSCMARHMPVTSVTCIGVRKI